MYKLSFFVPLEQAEIVKRAVFDAGAGKIGQYSECSWQTEGEGQFRPMDQSRPFLGQQGKLEKVAELKVEMVCEDNLIAAAVRALRQAHPYEEPAYDVVKLEAF